MKKFQKMCAVLAALALGLICFAGCSNDAGGSSGGGGNVSNNGGGNSNNEDEETPAITVVAKYVHEDASSVYFLFYSDGSFKCLDGNNTIYEGAYYGGTPTKTMSMTLEIKKAWDQNAGKPLPANERYQTRIDRDSYGNLYFSFEGFNFYLD